MKNSILCLVLLLTFSLSNAQEYPPVVDGNSRVEAKANKITEAYDRELAMTAKQRALFKLKVEDYLIIRSKIKSQYTGKEELSKLVEMQTQETLDMNDILTRIQMNVYKKIKPKIQPLKMVDTKKK